MTFLLDALVDLFARTLAWLAAESAIAAAASAGVWWAAGLIERPVPWRRVAIAALVGVLAGASIAHRFDLADPGHLAVWRRPLYPLWSSAGALLGSLVSLLPSPMRTAP